MATVLTLWLAFNLAVVGLAHLRYVARARWLRAQVDAMIEAAERHANSRIITRVGTGPFGTGPFGS